MIGVIQGMYWNHRRLWIQRIGDELWLAAHTNKNWYGLKNELNQAVQQTKIMPLHDQVDKDKG